MNDEMGMKGGSGTWRKPQHLRVCWTSLIQLRKQLSKILCFQTPWEICRHLAGACNSNNYTRGSLTFYFCLRRQAGGTFCIWHKSFKETCLRKVQHDLSFWIRWKPLQFWSRRHSCQKTTTSCKIREG
jgi:hypothetical protein